MGEKMPLELPKNYLNWISSFDLEDPIIYKDREYYLYGLDEMSEETTIDSQITPNYMQLQSYIAMQRQTTGQAPLSNIEAADCITIGENNGDPLFFKKKDTSLWRYHVDGGDIENVCPTLGQFIQESVIE